MWPSDPLRDHAPVGAGPAGDSAAPRSVTVPRPVTGRVRSCTKRWHVIDVDTILACRSLPAGDSAAPRSVTGHAQSPAGPAPARIEAVTGQTARSGRSLSSPRA